MNNESKISIMRQKITLVLHFIEDNLEYLNFSSTRLILSKTAIL